ncbi:hypothetical protein GOBAR_DD13962 [Gossypium barbadense]|nr:hypothetical protein GOBAR_DD13962 [Gossypium barbadense]
MIGTTIARHCGRKMSRLFYRFPISFNLLKFQQMELVNEEDLGTMVGVYCSNGDNNTKPIPLFVKLVDLDPIEHHDGEEYSNPNQDEVPDNIDNEGAKDGENIHPPSVGHSSHRNIIRNDPRADMLSVTLMRHMHLSSPSMEIYYLPTG